MDSNIVMELGLTREDAELLHWTVAGVVLGLIEGTKTRIQLQGILDALTEGLKEDVIQ